MNLLSKLLYILFHLTPIFLDFQNNLLDYYFLEIPLINIKNYHLKKYHEVLLLIYDGYFRGDIFRYKHDELYLFTLQNFY